jgi:hypothetical protein
VLLLLNLLPNCLRAAGAAAAAAELLLLLGCAAFGWGPAALVAWVCCCCWRQVWCPRAWLLAAHCACEEYGSKANMQTTTSIT